MPPMKFIVVWLVAVSISIWQKGHAQSYYDLYSNKEVYRTNNNQIIDVPDQSPISIQTESSSSVAVVSIVEHAAKASSAKASTVAVFIPIVFVAAGVVGVTLWLIHFMRKRKRLKLQKELGMTNQDTHLSGSAITNDPYRSLSTGDSFNIPMPEDAKQTKQPVTPSLSVTSPTGVTTHLQIPQASHNSEDVFQLS